MSTYPSKLSLIILYYVFNVVFNLEDENKDNEFFFN